MSEIIFRTKDHPEANGRHPQIGEEAYSMWFDLENGDKLTIHIGSKGITDLRNIVLSMQIDDDFEKLEGITPS